MNLHELNKSPESQGHVAGSLSYLLFVYAQEVRLSDPERALRALRVAKATLHRERN